MRSIFDYLLIQKPQVDDVELNTKTERRWARKRIKESKKEAERAIKEKNILKDKYIAILEEKCAGFDQYKYWEDKSTELDAENKSFKKDVANLKKQLKDFGEIVGKVINNKKVSYVEQIKDYDDFISYLFYAYYNDKINLEELKPVIEELFITKSMIKSSSEYLYDLIDAEKWDIE